MKTSLSPAARGAGILLAIATLGACGNAPDSTAHPLELTRDIACSLDGMTLMDYPGPKAQVVYEQGAPDFFCDTIELFAVLLKPEQQRRALAIYVQDMGQADWNSPEGHWIDARTAFYVTGSKRRGSMGPTIASFAREQDARALVAAEGGRVLRFGEVTPGMAVLDGGVLKDHRS